MMNDEARMTNDELMTKHEPPEKRVTEFLRAVAYAVLSGLGHWSFEFPSSFGIRHSSLSS
jgi:hypothetical protein